MSLVSIPRSTEIPATLRDELLSISRYAAQDVCLVQGSGGNTSVKAADTMWIKASGLTMADVGADRGYVAVDVQLALEMLRVGRWNNDVLSDHGRLRPSMEAGFHALLGPVVLHTHPVYLNAFAGMERGKDALQHAAPGAALWVDYCAPGLNLALLVRSALAGQRAPQAIVLANHGLIACGDTAAEAIATTDYLNSIARQFFGDLPEHRLQLRPPAPALVSWIADLTTALDRYLPERKRTIVPTRWRAFDHADPTCFEARPIFPDQVVWAPEQIFHVPPGRPAEEWLKSLASLPQRSILVVEGCGVVFVAESARVAEAMEENLLAAVLVRELIARRGCVRELSPADVDFLRDMESEKYRQAIASRAQGGH